MGSGFTGRASAAERIRERARAHVTTTGLCGRRRARGAFAQHACWDQHQRSADQLGLRNRMAARRARHKFIGLAGFDCRDTADVFLVASVPGRAPLRSGEPRFGLARPYEVLSALPAWLRCQGPSLCRRPRSAISQCAARRDAIGHGCTSFTAAPRGLRQPETLLRAPPLPLSSSSHRVGFLRPQAIRARSQQRRKRCSTTFGQACTRSRAADRSSFSSAAPASH
jgi:hypothetical protein